LTDREQQVVTMVAQGHTNKETSASLGITVKTVESHKTKIMQKLGINSRAELVRFAILQGWLDNSSA
jgi:DNA-binding NarL/FixJ family response regulator